MRYTIIHASFCKILFTLLVFTFIQTKATAQLLPETKAATEEPEKQPADSLGRNTPQGTINGFISAVSEGNYRRASQYFVLSRRAYRKEKARMAIAENFQKLLDRRGDLTPPSLISNREEGRTDDGLAAGVDAVGTITTSKTVITLYVENQSEDNEPALWLFSAETVNAVAEADLGEDTLLDRFLPETLKDHKLGGVPVGHWLVVVVMIVVAYLLSWTFIALLCWLTHKIWRKANNKKISAIIDALTLPLRLYISVLVFVAFTQRLGISIIVRQRFSVIIVTIGIIAFLMLLWRLADFISAYSKDKMTKRGRVSAISVILFLRRTAKVAIVIIGIIAVLGVIGVDVTAGLAALGIGGIALALGAQKTMENFVGSVTLIADQPIRVGDFCKIGDITGTVESIGMRSTRLRTGARTVVTIPNGEFSSSKIENYAHRDRFLFNHILYFRMDTKPDQMRYLLVEIRAILYAHPCVNANPANVRFTAITDNALKLEIWTYIEAQNFDISQEVQEDLLLRIMDVVAKSGTNFAFPTQTIYFAPDDNTSAEKAEETTQIVKDWKEKGELHLPRFDPKHIEELKGSIQYPEEGSVVKPENN